MTTFAQLLRMFRDARALTQEELAERAQLTVKAVGALERGERRRPFPHTVRALADALDLDEHERAGLVAAVPRRSDPLGGAPVPPEEVSTADPGASDWTPPVAVPPPVPAGPVVGRGDEILAVGSLLRAPVRRVVTLTGPGGVGKTTLGAMVAEQVRDAFPGGVVLVELADLADPGEVVPAIAAALGVPEAGFDGTAAALVPFLAGRRVLLVLCNLEHLLDCGPDVAFLVGRCADLVVLATSRAPLRIRPEQEVRVAPLPPDAAERLFRERAAAAGVRLDGGPRTAAAVATLCERADGLPLALELAASAAARLGPAALVERVDAVSMAGPRDLPARQRSMAATLAWSTELLSAPARSLLARLSVFVGGFTLAAVEEVGSGGVAQAGVGDVLNALTELVEHSLVTRVADVEGTERWRLLEPIRQDAAARLTPIEREDVRRLVTHAALETVRSVARDLWGAGQSAALNLLEADLGNLRLAFDQLLDDHRTDDAVDLLWSVRLHLHVRGHARDGIRWTERLRGRPMGDRSRIRWLVVWAGLEYAVGAVARSRTLAEDGLQLAERAEHDALAAEAASIAGISAMFLRDLAGARRLLACADEHVDGADNRWISIQVRIVEGRLALLAGDPDGADRLLRAAEAAARELGGGFPLATALYLRAGVAEHRGEHRESASLLAESIALCIGAVSSWTLASALPALAGVAVRLGDLTAAARLFGASTSYTVPHDMTTAFWVGQEPYGRDLDRTRTGLGEEAFAAAWDEGRRSTAETVVELARAVGGRTDG